MDVLGIGVPIWMVLIVVALVLAYRKLTSQFSFFDDQNIPGPKAYPLIGTMYGLFQKGVLHYDRELYKQFGKPRVVRLFQMGDPHLLIFDKEMVKQVVVKEFSSFTNRKNVKGLTSKPPMSKMVSILEDDEWRNVRAHISPTFSASKMRRMVPLIHWCGHNFTDNLLTTSKAGEALELKDVCTNYATDVIGSVAFGIQIDSQKDKNNTFIKMQKKMFNFSMWNPLVWVFFLCPSLIEPLKKVGLSLFSEEAIDFFVDIVRRTIKQRKDDPDDSAPADFLKLMIEGQNEFEKMPKGESNDYSTPRTGLTEDEILAQGLVFFTAGLSTISTLMSFTLHHLAVHQDIQEKAYQEVNDVMGDDDPDYENMKKLNYIQMCIDETSRIYPPAFRIDRVCSADTDICGIKISKGVVVDIPIAALHRDPDVWPDPEKFDPERFTPEEKAGFVPYQFMPFGAGPRVCVAQRLAIMEIKIGIAHILKKYKLVMCDKTEDPPKMKAIVVEAQNGLWIKAEMRT